MMDVITYPLKLNHVGKSGPRCVRHNYMQFMLNSIWSTYYPIELLAFDSPTLSQVR